MSLVNLVNVEILNNPSGYFDNFQFEITFEVLSELQEDLEFKVIYVGSAESTNNDQVLESVMVGPGISYVIVVPVGVSKFVLEAPAPKVELIPESDIVGLTVMLLSCFYRDKEFIRVGYYVNNDYADPELRENPPSSPDFSKLCRSILAEKPRVTRFPIPWDNLEEKQEEKVQDQDMSEVMNIEV
ncbi:ASF1 anti-silencing function 1 [Boothiomyces sp. JEL0838]|nr:ASF1 anti-silencing function 1 [Boothiomyces sp. JEL0838]